jgi:hypothetical protein
MDGSVALLSDRPKWIVPTILKWLTIIPVGAVLLFFVTAQWAIWELEKLYETAISQPEEGPLPFEWGYDLWDLAGELIWLVPTMGFLWLLSVAADKLDQLVWLNASEQDRREILARRKRGKLK